MHIVISDPKTGKSYQAEIPKDREYEVVGKKIGEELEGEIIGANGYVFELKGGSDGSGFPMRSDINGQGKKEVLLTEGVGFHTKRNGERKRRYVQANTYTQEIVQINVKVLKYGQTNLEELLGKKDSEEKEKKE